MHAVALGLGEARHQEPPFFPIWENFLAPYFLRPMLAHNALLLPEATQFSKRPPPPGAVDFFDGPFVNPAIAHSFFFFFGAFWGSLEKSVLLANSRHAF